MRKMEHTPLLLLAAATLLVLAHSSVVDGTAMVAPVLDPYKAALMSGSAGSDTLAGGVVSSSPSVASVVTAPSSTTPTTSQSQSQSSESTPNKPSSQSSSSDQPVPPDQSQTVQLQIPSPFDGVNSSYLQMTESDYQSLLANLTVIHGPTNVKGVQVKGIDSAGATGNFLVIRIVDSVTAVSAKPTKGTLDSKIAASLTKSSSQISFLGIQPAPPTPSTPQTPPTPPPTTASSLQTSAPPGAPFSSPQASAQPLASGTPVQNYSGAVTSSPSFSNMYPPSPAGYPPSMQPPFQPMYNLGYTGVSQLPPSQLPPPQLPPSQLSPQSSSQGAPTYQSNLGQTVTQPPNYAPRQTFWPGYNPYQYQPPAATYPSGVRYGGYNYQNYVH